MESKKKIAATIFFAITSVGLDETSQKKLRSKNFPFNTAIFANKTHKPFNKNCTHSLELVSKRKTRDEKLFIYLSQFLQWFSVFFRYILISFRSPQLQRIHLNKFTLPKQSISIFNRNRRKSLFLLYLFFDYDFFLLLCEWELSTRDVTRSNANRRMKKYFIIVLCFKSK